MKTSNMVAAEHTPAFPKWEFVYLDIEYDAAAQALWMNYKETAPHHFPLRMFEEIVAAREAIRALFASGDTARWPIRYFVIASKRKDVFALGGDLADFARSVRSRDVRTLEAHARICVDIMHGLITGFGLPIVTLSVVHGQCLGGGFEGALVTDFLFAERSARLGLPEVAFNTFPGMGAVSLLTRRAGMALAEQMISSGAVYAGEELYDLGVVDALAPDGQGRETATAWMLEGGEARWLKRRLLAEARRRHFPVTQQELDRIVRVWVDCVAALPDRDLRHMDRLVAAQKRLSRAIHSASAEQED